MSGHRNDDTEGLISSGLGNAKEFRDFLEERSGLEEHSDLTPKLMTSKPVTPKFGQPKLEQPKFEQPALNSVKPEAAQKSSLEEKADQRTEPLAQADMNLVSPVVEQKSNLTDKANEKEETEPLAQAETASALDSEKGKPLPLPQEKPQALEGKRMAAPELGEVVGGRIESNTDDLSEEEALDLSLDKIEVPRDAEILPKEYSRAVRNIVEKNKDNPKKLVTQIDVARWNYLKKAFNRKMGDGFMGTA